MFRKTTKTASHFIVTALTGRHVQLANLFPSTAERVVRLRAR